MDQQGGDGRADEGAEVGRDPHRGVGGFASVAARDEIGDEDAIERVRGGADDALDNDQGEGDPCVLAECRERGHVRGRGQEAGDDWPLTADAIGDVAAEVIRDRGHGRREQEQKPDLARPPTEPLDGVHADVDPEGRERGAVDERDGDDRHHAPLDRSAERGP